MYLLNPVYYCYYVSSPSIVHHARQPLIDHKQEHHTRHYDELVGLIDVLYAPYWQYLQQKGKTTTTPKEIDTKTD